MNKKKVLVISMILMWIFMFTLPSVYGAAAQPALDYDETFETDTNNANPSESWYTYTETGWEYANATTGLGRGASSRSYRINDSNGAGNSSTFTVTANNFNYFEAWFLYDNTSHNVITVSVYSSTTELAKFIINATVNASIDDYCLFQNNTAGSGFNETLANGTWYKIRFTLNYSDNTVYGQIFNSTEDALNNSWVSAFDGASSFTTISSIQISGSSGHGSYIWFDDFNLYKSAVAATGTDATVNYVTDTVVPILVAVLVIITISGMVLTTGVTKETLMGAMMAAIIGAIVISVIAGL
jgi:hypothetical protein